ncbi:hypothetical protein BEL04_23450 [Mucilaginibacter sp. PPCGB 2223]|uniref:hypothetical protein n=1 Tax=Mucilaginibacter sp. PPCGB 2223 TaxID=1886027 RepID=UPI0008255986|nr:hypothetical protein [Mucilaginibacter sp. PPCGB 2223]OCX50268.1 hypothetical protein BEL04_23450 [Mucilaginibacter sp. PPCGB 2223]
MNKIGNNELDPGAYKKLQVIHAVFAAITAVFVIIIVCLNKHVGANILNRNDNSLLYVAFAATILFPIISNYVFYKRVEEIDLDEPVRFRFSNFLTANIIRYMWIFGAATLDLMVWFFTATILVAAFVGFLFLVFLLIRPIRFKVVRMLRLKPINKAGN